MQRQPDCNEKLSAVAEKDEVAEINYKIKTQGGAGGGI